MIADVFRYIIPAGTSATQTSVLVHPEPDIERIEHTSEEEAIRTLVLLEN